MFKEMIDALMEVWINKDLTPDAEEEYQKLTDILQNKGLSEMDIALTQERAMAFGVAMQDEAYRAGFQICMDLINGRLK